VTRGLIERVLRDPNAIWMREMRQSARLGRTPWVLFALTLTLGLLMCSIGGLSAASDTSTSQLPPSRNRRSRAAATPAAAR